MADPTPIRSCQCNRKLVGQESATFCVCVPCPNEMTEEDLLCDECRWAKNNRDIHCHRPLQMDMLRRYIDNPPSPTLRGSSDYSVEYLEYISRKLMERLQQSKRIDLA